MIVNPVLKTKSFNKSREFGIYFFHAKGVYKDFGHCVTTIGTGSRIKYLENSSKQGQIKKIFSKNPTIFCYCISDYPLQFSKIDWKTALQFDGFSDHTIGITAALIFAILKKQKNASMKEKGIHLLSQM